MSKNKTPDPKLSARPQNKPGNNIFFIRSVESAKEKRLANELEYSKNPKHCLNCNKKLEYDDRIKKFCNKSCSATYNNALRPPMLEEQKAKISESIRKYNDLVGKESHYPCSRVTFSYCQVCNLPFRKTNSPIKSCKKCKELQTNENIKFYRKSCKFKLNHYDNPELFDGELIKMFGWYSPSNSKNPNLTGLTWDHLFRIEEGFKLKVSIEIITHPANAELVPFQVNLQRRKSMITLEELLDRIKRYDAGDRNLPTFYRK